MMLKNVFKNKLVTETKHLINAKKSDNYKQYFNELKNKITYREIKIYEDFTINMGFLFIEEEIKKFFINKIDNDIINLIYIDELTKDCPAFISVENNKSSKEEMETNIINKYKDELFKIIEKLHVKISDVDANLCDLQSDIKFLS